MNQFGKLSQVLSRCRQQELILSAARTAQPQTSHLQDPLEMGKQHLDALAALPRPLKGWRAPQGARDLPGMLIDAARDPAGRRVGTAALLEVARTTVKGAAQVVPVRAFIHDPAAGGQGLAFGTTVGVRLRVIAE